VTRKYELKRRAERQAETRRRIVDATIQLHETVGAHGATISEIARRAGVSRLTVYRHFPDELSLLQACTGTYNVEHPVPDPSGLMAVPDPRDRLEAALDSVYRYYAENEAMLSSGADAMPSHPALGVALQPFFEGMDQLVDLLGSGWDVEAGRGSLVRGAIAHAVAFSTWRALHQEQGLTNRQAAQLMFGMVTSAVERSGKESRDTA
jgi:AcrR family transcriptional regulator